MYNKYEYLKIYNKERNGTMFKRKEDKATKSTLAQNSAATQNFMEITDDELSAITGGGSVTTGPRWVN